MIGKWPAAAVRPPDQQVWLSFCRLDIVSGVNFLMCCHRLSPEFGELLVTRRHGISGQPLMETRLHVTERNLPLVVSLLEHLALVY